MTALSSESIDLLKAVALSRAETRSAQVAEVAPRILQWDAAFDAADCHGVLPLVYSELAKSGHLVPPDVLMQARKEFERNAFHSLTNAAELLEILGSFEQAGIAAMPFKGVVLASQLYGDLAMRAAGDLDLLIFRRDLEKATELLKGRGYDRKPGLLADSSGEVFEHGFVRGCDGMVVELRWRLEMSHPNLSRVRFYRDLGLEWVWPQRAMTDLAGMQVPTLAPEHNLLMLCMHGSKHLWSRLMWVIDVARALEIPMDWEFVDREAKRTGLRTALSLGVLLANRMAGAPVPGAVLARYSRNREASSMAVYFSENLLKSPGARPSGMLPYNIRLMENRDRLKLLVSHRTFRPNQLDRAFIKLPRSLHFLYYVVRPIRILVDRSAR